PCDVTDADQVQRLPGVVEQAFGPADVLVNNAGIPGGGELPTLTFEQIEAVVRVNLLGVLFGTRAFLPGMLARGHGHVVNMASLAGRFAAPGASVYSATKHAVVAFSEALNYDTEARGVLVTTVNPAFVVTEGFPPPAVPPPVLLEADRVGEAVVRVVRKEIAPEYSIPRWVSPFQVFRVLTPTLYRWGVRKARRRTPPTPPPPPTGGPAGGAGAAPPRAARAADRGRDRMGGGLAPIEVERPEADEVVEPDIPWIVIVWNDPINLMSYVTWVFQKLFGYPKTRAGKP